MDFSIWGIMVVKICPSSATQYLASTLAYQPNLRAAMFLIRGLNQVVCGRYGPDTWSEAWISVLISPFIIFVRNAVH
jgi:hypothetical protein